MTSSALPTWRRIIESLANHALSSAETLFLIETLAQMFALCHSQQEVQSLSAALRAMIHDALDSRVRTNGKLH